jgi:uncharacterized protein (TIGR03067 family)
LAAPPQDAPPAPSANRAGIEALTQVGTVMGTPDYIAPEQAQDAHLADIRADIYSLGCTFYDLLAGHAPFPEGTVVAKVLAHMERSPRPLTELRPDVPPALARVVERMMAKDPAKRYQTPAEVADALAGFSSGATVRPRVPASPRRWWIAAGLLGVLALAAAVIIIVKTSRGEITIKTDDSDIEVVTRKNGDLVLIRDTKTGKTWDLDTKKLNLGLADDPDGLRIELDGKQPFVLRRRGGGLVVITGPAEEGTRPLPPQPPPVQPKAVAGPARAGPRNPFGLPDVEDPDGGEVQAFAARTKLPGGPDDPNAEQWVTQATRGDKDSLDGEWFCRWRNTGETEWNYCKGTARIKTVGGRVYLRYTDHQGRFLMETRREKGRLIGRERAFDKEEENWPCVFEIVSPERLDGDYGGQGRLDFRRKLEQRDEEKIQGVWEGVSARVQGQPMPDLFLKTIGPTITFAGNKVTWRANPTPEAKDLFGGMLANFSLDGVFHLDATKSPKTIDLMVLGPNAKTPLGTPAPRALLGIYRLDGDTLEMCIAVDPEHPEDRPGKFESIPGKFIAHVVLKRVSARLWQAPLPDELKRPSNVKPAGAFTPGTVRSFRQTDKPIGAERLKEDQRGWRIDVEDGGVIPLFEVTNFRDDACLAIYRARMKTAGLRRRATLELLVHVAGDPEDRVLSSRNWDDRLTGTGEWASCQTTFALAKGQWPDRVRLNVVIEGKGNEQGESFKINLYDHGSGVAVGDFDGDGLDDIYLVNQVGPNALYRNKGDGTFEDVAAAAGVALGDRVCVGATFIDYDNDGPLDLFETRTTATGSSRRFRTGRGWRRSGRGGSPTATLTMTGWWTFSSRPGWAIPSTTGRTA